MKNYKEVKTQDGSITLYSSLYDEACHSTTGAISETKLHYIEGCEIATKMTNLSCINILEVGFGTGIGFLETAKLFNNSTISLQFISLEIDLELLEIFAKSENIKFIQDQDVYRYHNNNVSLSIYLGNARESVKRLQQAAFKADAIYQDAFSPKRNAILWTTQWFKDLIKLAAPTVIMSTYSSSSSIRKSMQSAGWKLYEGARFGAKRSSTRARLTGDTEVEIIKKLERSPVEELTDDNYQNYKLK